ncbi:amidohydrolase [Phocicoccus pinnipedialis]|uniref:Indole-3-acetyl-aspartic acid hydrolase n=1 Tax=Phocicoccus pinnipedialis TaxID=110845 RepID=A0A6V7RDA4_9BACL|nr:amidohydrolase [Jeotgalicoccus pinnipedialis]MBP1939520.1 aminobenzoyl-glutamate utilization protein A [Jeotgalicoccus pinnipedialis]CAD2075045.1 Indole-3-acetyl-aspartic acid hydrolase [Jeotgalicoccus pinnipedialis]
MKNLIDEAKKLRRTLHQYPEVGFTEMITTYLILKEIEHTSFKLYLGSDATDISEQMGRPSDEELLSAAKRAEAFGVDKKTLSKVKNGETGIVAVLDTGEEGTHVGFRFDIDGLPITEAEKETHIPYSEGFKSKHNGEMHACGHDAHASIGVALLKYLDANKHALKGKYTIIFQAAEEGLRGANSYVTKGWLDTVDYFFTSHVGLVSKNVGSVNAKSEGFLSSKKFDVEFFGKSAHAGGEPNAGNNALLAASNAAINLNAISRHKEGATRLNVGKLEAGSGRNVIPDYAFMMCEVRGAKDELTEYMFKRAESVIKGAAEMYDCDYKIRLMGNASTAECDDLFDLIKTATENNKYVIEVNESGPAGGSEDATYMLNAVQKNNGKATYMTFPYKLTAGHHHPEFDVDEEVLGVAISTYVDIVNELNKI